MGCYFGPSDMIFKFLDKDDEGSICVKEFQTLERFVAGDIKEFVNFLERMFGEAPDFLDQAWNALDDDGSGMITKKEWRAIVRDKLAYFGQTIGVFNYLDKD